MDDRIKTIRHEKQKRLGIIGGLGAETSAKLCLAINQEVRKLTGIQPDIVLENVPMPDDEVISLLNGEKTNKTLGILTAAVKNLNQVNVDFIIIPCNTVHIFIDELRALSEKPILSIIEETAKRCNELCFRKIGLLGTQTTINSNLFGKVFEREHVEIKTPNNHDQKIINQVVVKIIDEKMQKKDKQQIQEIIKRLQAKGTQAVILGCTDLQLLVNEKDVAIPLINTCKVLEDAAVRMIVRND